MPQGRCLANSCWTSNSPGRTIDYVHTSLPEFFGQAHRVFQLPTTPSHQLQKLGRTTEVLRAKHYEQPLSLPKVGASCSPVNHHTDLYVYWKWGRENYAEDSHELRVPQRL